jgi:hypothetical protein
MTHPLTPTELAGADFGLTKLFKAAMVEERGLFAPLSFCARRRVAPYRLIQAGRRIYEASSENTLGHKPKLLK